MDQRYTDSGKAGVWTLACLAAKAGILTLVFPELPTELSGGLW